MIWTKNSALISRNMHASYNANAEAVHAGRTQLFMQPVVKLPMRQSSLYEVYSRIRISPGVYMPAAHFLK